MTNFDLDALFASEQLPKTYEEWVAIHGEPELLYEENTAPVSDLDILTIDNKAEEEPIDTEGIFYQSSKGKLSINYGKFVDVFAAVNKCVYSNGTFYTPNGAVSASEIRKDIANSLKDQGWTDKLDVPTNSLFASLKDMYSADCMEADSNTIPFANGDLHIVKGGQWEFHLDEKRQTPYRLRAEYVPLDKPTPLFDKWLHDVFAEEDIPTIQEMLGYMLVPSTNVQEAFFLVGDGGVGKSVLGIILESILGQACRAITTQELVSQRFQLATIENKLCMYDDDLGSAALTETAILKKIITADQNIPAERKYGDPYEFRPYCKIVACANFMLSSLYDDSDGFFRRLHPIQVKPKDKHRKVIKDFGKLMVSSERDQIVRFALRGLKRLQENNWKITWSDRSRDYIGTVKDSANHFDNFFQTVFAESPTADVSSAEIGQVYDRWCKANDVTPKSRKRLAKYFMDLSLCRPNQHIKRDGKQVRGYSGIEILPEWKNITLI